MLKEKRRETKFFAKGKYYSFEGEREQNHAVSPNNKGKQRVKTFTFGFEFIPRQSLRSLSTQPADNIFQY